MKKEKKNAIRLGWQVKKRRKYGGSKEELMRKSHSKNFLIVWYTKRKEIYVDIVWS